MERHHHHYPTPRCSGVLKTYPAKVDLKRNKSVEVAKMKQAESIQTKIDQNSRFILGLQEKFGAI